MKVIKGHYPNGEKMYSAFPMTIREVKRLFLVYGLHAWPVKFGHLWTILYPRPKEHGGPVMHHLDIRTIDSLTCKRWLEIARANAPEYNILRDYYDGMPGWGNLNQYIEKETLN